MNFSDPYEVPDQAIEPPKRPRLVSFAANFWSLGGVLGMAEFLVFNLFLLMTFLNGGWPLAASYTPTMLASNVLMMMLTALGFYAAFSATHGRAVSLMMLAIGVLVLPWLCMGVRITLEELLALEIRNAWPRPRIPRTAAPQVFYLLKAGQIVCLGLGGVLALFANRRYVAWRSRLQDHHR